MSSPLSLRTDELEVQLDPDRGADILGVVDRQTGSQILYRTPWADSAQLGVWAPDSRQAWVAAYRGGWQLLCPNAGDASERKGGTWGFHGEACMLRWTVVESAPTEAQLSVRLSQAPLSIRRHVEVFGASLRVRDTVRNEGRVPVAVSVLEHVAFGAPLVGPGASLWSGARSLRAADRPWPGLAPYAEAAFAALAPMSLPEGGPGQAGLGFLTDFDDHWAAITSCDADLGVALAWNGETLPHAWLWLEGNATEGLPWYRSEYIVGIEPTSTIPATGVEAVEREGGNLIELAPGDETSSTVTLTVHHDRRPVTGMTLDGKMTFATSGSSR